MRFHRDNLTAAFRGQLRHVHGAKNLADGKRLNASFNRFMDYVERDTGFDDGTSVSIRQCAYTLATAYHESAYTFEPIEEYGRGAGRFYGIPVRIAAKRSVAYYGRGYVQLTWAANYGKASALCGVDFISRPELTMEPQHAYRIMADGMRRGWFTGKRLSDYINAEACDYREARRVVNGTDRAALIAGYAAAFETILVLSRIKDDEARVCVVEGKSDEQV